MCMCEYGGFVPRSRLRSLLSVFVPFWRAAVYACGVLSAGCICLMYEGKNLTVKIGVICSIGLGM